MNRSNWGRSLGLLLAISSTSMIVAAAEPTPTRVLTPDWVTRTLLERNDSRRAAALGMARAEQAIQGEQGRLGETIFEADAGYTRSQTPSLGQGNDVLVSTRDSMLLGAQLERSFVTGTSVTLRAEGERFDSSRPTTAVAGTNQSGVGYQTSLRATVNQSLLKGYGREANEANLRALRISKTQSERAYDRQTSELLRDALAAYWELWYASRAVEINEAALELAKEQQKDALARVAQGALPPAEALQFETQIASLTESLLVAKATVKQQALTVAALVGQNDGVEGWLAAEAGPSQRATDTTQSALSRAMAENPSLQELNERVRLAREQQKTAGEEYRSRLDLTGWAQLSGLGASRVSPALRQVGEFSAVSVYAGLTYQTPLDSRQWSAARARASHDVAIAEAELAAAKRNLESSIRRQQIEFVTAEERLNAARLTAGVAERQVVLERQRFALGASTSLAVEIVQDSLRQARLRVRRAEVDRERAWLTLADASGELLRSLSVSATSKP